MGFASVGIVMDIEDRFGIEITDAEAARCERVGDL
jgi:acyl carrier protein